MMKIEVKGEFENRKAYEKHHIKVRYLLKLLKVNRIKCDEDLATGKIIFSAETIKGTQSIKEEGEIKLVKE